MITVPRKDENSDCHLVIAQPTPLQVKGEDNAKLVGRMGINRD